jgi:hypothetical protein
MQPDPAAAEPPARERVRTLAEAFWTDLDKATVGELSEFRTEFVASLTDLDATRARTMQPGSCRKR